ncbi:MAG: patatin family protein [Clostridia bacterium]|nr:patatin family protein [Clostridia bacterium]
MKIGLVLEGGGMRGIYTVGVLDCLMEEQFNADYVIGVSAGACNGISYVSKQKGRAFHTNTKYISDSRYLSIQNFIKTKSLFGMDFLFDTIPNELIPFDYETFYENPCEFVMGVTDVITGTPKYFDKSACEPKNTVLRASSSIPVFSPIVEYQGGKYLDGGTTDAIPVKKALEDGCDKVIVVLTRERSYQKAPEKFRHIYRRIYKNYPKMIEALDNRHKNYNHTLAYLKELEQQGTALVIAPDVPLPVGRFEKDPEQLKKVWQIGYNDGKKQMKQIWNLCKKSPVEELI